MDNIILNHEQIRQKITRLGHQLLENCFEEPVIFLGGICGNGIILANELKKIIAPNSDQQIEVFEFIMNKDEPWKEPITLSIEENKLKNGYIIMVDDVLNSGKTMPTKAIKTIALVDRAHHRYPIKADFVGLSLSTTLKERVEVTLNDTNSHAYLV